MINVYIISGFLGAGKTTFIQKLLKEKKFEKVMLLENEFGEVGVDSAFFDSALNVKEINNGCICCSLQGDFESALEEIEKMEVTDLIIEPSGVGKLSEIINVIKADEDYRIVSHICIVDVKTAIKYHNNFKDYFDDQVKSANALILSHTDVALKDKIDEVKSVLKELNPGVSIIDNINSLSIEELLNAIVAGGYVEFEECEHHHHDDEDECCHHHHHHDEEHHHHHHHDEDECCHEEGEEHHHHHHDDEIFDNVIVEPKHVFSKEELENILSKMPENIIRVKGYVNGEEGKLYFNYVLNEYKVYVGENRENNLVSIIGTDLCESELKEAFHE